MKAIASLLFSAALYGQTPGFWQSEPYTTWSAKEIHKLETASPWSKSFWVSFGVPDGFFDDTVHLTVSWQSALPLRQALARKRFSNQAAASPDARKLIEEEPRFYQILVTVQPAIRIFPTNGRPVLMVGDTSLSVVGKVPFPAVDVQTGGDEKKAYVLFLFPRINPISLNDKEVDFSTKLGPFQASQSFRLKDMVVNGKLEL